MKTKIFFLFIAILFFSELNSKDVFAAGQCTAGETCMKVISDSSSSTKFSNPPGYECTFRNACSGADTACCAPTTQNIMDSCNGKTEGAACSIADSFTGTCKLIPGSQNLYCNDPSNTANTGGSSNITTPNGADCATCFTNPLKFKTIEDFLANFMSVMQKIIVTLALVFIVIGAMLILTSAGESGQAENGKKAITAALIGLAIGIAAPSILKELAGILGWGGTGNAAVDTAMSFTEIAIRVLNFLLGLFGILSLVMMVLGGTMYLTSAGNEDQIDRGKNIFKYSLIGIVIAMSSMVLVTQIARLFVK